MIAAGDWNQFSGQDTHSIVWTNPASQLFTNLANGDFTLKEGSAAIDSGAENNAPNVDYAGSVRPQGAGYDIGAYEYGSSSVRSTTSSTPTSPTSTAEAPDNASLLLEYTVLAVVAVIVAFTAVAAVLVKRRVKSCINQRQT